MHKHLFADTFKGALDWFASGKGRIPTWYRMLTIIVLLACAGAGYYFLGTLGAIVGILAAVGMMDEISDMLFPKKVATRTVFCPQCGLEQEWVKDKRCERCWSDLRK